MKKHNLKTGLSESEFAERERLLELQKSKTRFFSQDEFDRLEELSNKMFENAGSPQDENNQGKEREDEKVILKTYHFMDWVNGKHVDETIQADNREAAIKYMSVKYPNHDFAYVCELS